MAEKRLPKKNTNSALDENLTYQFERNRGTLVVVLNGEADLVGSSKLRQSLVRRLDGIHEIVFDLTNLKFADSYFLRLLIALRKRLGGVSSVKVRNVRPNVRRVFEITGLDKLFIQGD